MWGNYPARRACRYAAFGTQVLIALVLCTGASHAQNCAPVPSGLVGWWKGDGGATDAVGSNNGALVGNASFAPGLVGQAFSFDGDNDSVMIGNPATLQLQNFTIEAWIKRASTNHVSLDSIFLAGTIFGYGYGGYTFDLSDDGRLTLGQVGLSAISSTLAIRDTNWHHVSVTKAAGSVTFYPRWRGGSGTAVRSGLLFYIECPGWRESMGRYAPDGQLPGVNRRSQYL